MEKRVYVIGHKNPDTDSVVAAASYAELKRAQGMTSCRAARAGAVNPQTEYIFERFAAELPEFVPDLIPKVEYWLGAATATVCESVSLWEALASMDQAKHKALPIVDAAGRYQSLLHYGAFAQNMLARVNPHRKSTFLTSVALLLKTVRGQPLVTCDPDEPFGALVVVATHETSSFAQALAAEPAHNKVVLVGDRRDVQRIAIEAGVRAVIVTGGTLVAREERELAEQRRVSLLVSPYDTSSTALLAQYSTPVGTVGDREIKPLSGGDLMRVARSALASSPSRSVPVVDDDGHVAGLFAEGDLIREPNIELILVDHHEFSQAVEGVENYRILEVIDHHRLGTFTTRYPITFINRVVGSTSTIVAGMYREGRVPLSNTVASLLLCGLLSDTLVLQSATTTDADREIAEYLAGITGLEIGALGRDIMAVASEATRRPASEVLRLDMKEYTSAGRKLSVSQVEVTSTDAIMGRRAELLAGLAQLRASGGYYLSALMVTDITNLSSLLLVDADRELLSLIGYPRVEPGVYQLKDVLSRKKQLMPTVFELVERATER